MIRAGGGSYRNHSSPPPPPPLPPSPPPNPSSSSTLSPLARPFTLDHVLPSPPPPSHHPLQPLPAADRPPASRLSSHSSASARSLRSHPSTGPVGDPYYVRYYSNSQPRAIDDSLGSSLAYFGAGAGPWNRPFDEEAGRGKRTDAISSWTEPSLSYKVPPCLEELATDGRSYYDNDSYGVWHGKFADSLTGKVQFGTQSSEWLQDKHPENYEQDMASSYTIFSAPFSAPSALLEGIHCSGTADSTSGMGSHDTFVSNSTYDRYMAQLDSCSVNPLVFYPAATCSTASQVYAPSNLRASSNTNSTLSHATVHHEVPYKINEPWLIPSKPKDPNLNQNFGNKGGYDEKRGEDYNVNRSSVLPADFGKYFPSSNNTAGESPLNLSAVSNPVLKLENLDIADASPSTCSSVEPDKSIKSSSEALDQHNLAVDSPCWKGAPASRQSPFTIDEMLVVQTAIDDSKDFNDLCQDQKHLLEGVGNSKSPAEQVGSLIFDEGKKSSISKMPQCPSVVSSSIHQKPENANKKLFDYSKDESVDEILYDDVHREQMNETIQVEKKISEEQDVGAAKFVETESIAVNKFPPAKGIDDCSKGPCSLPHKNMKELVKAIHSYSIELLSTNFSGDVDLEPHDYRLLYSAINSIALILKDKKGCVGGPHCSGLEAAWSCNRCLNTDDVNQNNMNRTCNMKRKIHSDGCNIVNDEFDNFVVKGCDTDLRKVSGMTQTFENALSKTFSEREENAQTLLYKNLWIEAEVATCRLKYELQLAQMKIESENLKPARSDTSSSLPFALDLEGYNSPSKAKGSLSGTISPTLGSKGISCQNHHEASATHELNNSEDIESSVMARLKVLKDRIVSSNYRSMEEQETIFDADTGTSSGTKENVHGSPDVANSSGMKDLPTNLADLGFVESVAQPSAKDKPRPWSSLLKTGPDVQPLGATSDDEIGPGLSISGFANSKEMFSGPLNGSLIQSYMTYNQGNWSLGGGHEYPTFEWEHVLREESTQ